MAILSRKNLGSVEILKVNSNPNGVVSSTAKSLAKHTNGSVYECQGGTSWILLQTYSNVKPAISSSGASEGGSGPQGAQGATGPQGTQGNPGASGPQGTQGSQGSQGPQGGKGSQGAQGNAGLQGAQGSSSAGGSSLILLSSDNKASAGQYVDFSGLDGDADKIYVIKQRLIKSVTTSYTYYFYPNGSSSNLSSHYHSSYYSSASGSGTSTGQLADGSYGSSGGVDNWNITMYIFAARNSNRIILSEYSRYGVATTNHVQEMGQRSIIWRNSTDNLTSIRLASSNSTGFGIGTETFLYRLEV